MSDKFEFLKESFGKTALNLSKYGLEFRSSLMNKPKALVNCANGRLLNERVVLPLGPTMLKSLMLH